MSKFKIKNGKLVKTESVDTEFTLDEIEAKIQHFISAIATMENDLVDYQAEVDKWNALKAEYIKLNK